MHFNKPTAPNPSAPMSEPRGHLILRDLLTIATTQAQHHWQPFRDGVEICRLYKGSDGPTAALLRYAPNTATPAHLHTGSEFILVLSGSQSDEHGHYSAGAVLASPPDSKHRVVSESGCIVLAIWTKPVEFL